MAKSVKYVLTKNKKTGKVKTKEIKSLEGYEIKPKNHLVGKKLLEVDKIIIIKLKLIQKLLTKKINMKMKKILQDIEDNENPSPSDLKKVLDEVEHLRVVLRNKYIEYLKREKTESLLDKTNYLLQEVAVLAIEKEEKLMHDSVNEYANEDVKTL